MSEPTLGVAPVPVRVNFNVSIDAQSQITLFSHPLVIPQNIIVAERELPVSALYDEDLQKGLLEVWEPSDSQGDIKTQLANTDSSGNGGPDLTGAYQVASKTFAQGLQAVLCDAFDCSGVNPFSITKYRGIPQYTRQRDFGRVALAYFAHVLFGHVDATAAITNDKAFVESMLSLNNYGDDETATGADNRITAWVKDTSGNVETWDSSGSAEDANLALRLVEAVIAKGKDASGNFVVSSVQTGDSNSLANIVKQVIGQDSSRMNSVDGSERTRDQHQLLRFYPNDVIYVNINVQPPTVEVANFTPNNPNNVANPPSTSSMTAKSFTLKITLTDGEKFLYTDATKTVVNGYKGTVPANLVIPAGVTGIADETFLNATTLQTVTLPEGLLSIGARAFKGCTALTTIDIPSSVVSIGEAAFEGCTSLASAFLPGTGTRVLQRTLLGAASTPTPLRFLKNREILTSDAYKAYMPKPKARKSFVPRRRAVNRLIPKPRTESMDDSRMKSIAQQRSLLLARSVFSVLPVSVFAGCTSLATVLIPATVSTIKANAFDGCASLESITLPTAVTVIESAAFKATGLVEVTLPPNITAVPSNAFQNCVELLSIEIPSNITSIGALAFYGCVKLEEVIMNEGVTTIATQAFQDCVALVTVDLPNSLVSIAARAFQGASSLAPVIVPITVSLVTDTNPSFPSAVTVKFIEPTTDIVYSSPAATEIVGFGRPEPPADPDAPPPPPPTPTTVTVPAGTVTIKAGAFRDTTSIAITAVVIPSSVATIEAGAFTGTSLTTVRAPVDATVASGAFENTVVLDYLDFATNLVYANTGKTIVTGYNGTVPSIVALPSSALTVKAGAFAGSALTTLRHNSFTTVESGGIESSVVRQYIHYATNFVYEDTGFTGLVGYNGTVPSSLSLSASVTTIRANAFANNAQLTSVAFPSSLGSIEAGAFSTTGLTLARIPVACTFASGAFDLAATVQYVDFDTDFVYSDVAKTTLAGYNGAIPSTVAIPSGVTTIAANTFSGATTLRSVSIPATVTTMGSAVFSGCTFLGSATIAAPLTTIPASTFMNCPFLSTLVLPSTLVTIGSQAFRNTAFTSVDLPNVLDIGAQAFYNNTAITDITARQVSTIASDAFTGCTSLQEYPAEGSRLLISGTMATGYTGTLNGTLTIPDGIEVIGVNAFQTQASLRGINFPTTLRNISTFAFSNTGLRGVTLPASISSLGSNVFAWNRSLTSITFPTTAISSIDAGAFRDCTSLEIGVIPPWMTTVPNRFYASSGIKGIDFQGNTTTILDGAFAGTAISSFSSPTSLTTLNQLVFQNCSNMSSITLGNVSGSLPTLVFRACTALQSIVIPPTVTTLETSVFQDCTALQSIVLPPSVTSIGTNVFSNCTSLESADIQGPITTLATSLFSGCTNLSSFTIPPTVTTTGQDALRGCSKLSSIVIPPSVTSLGVQTFRDCTSLSSIVVPASVTSYGTNLFLTCRGLTEATILRTGLTSIPSGMFDACSALTLVNMDTRSVTTIGSLAFRNTRISTMTLSSVTTMGDLAFGNNPNLSTVFAPNATRIHSAAFSGSSALQDYPATASTFTIAAGGILTAVGGGSVAGRLTIPTGVSTIGASLFLNQTSMIGVSFPTTLRNISTAAFSNTGLRDVTLPASLSSLGARAFNRCTALSSITWPSTRISTIQNDVFASCTTLPIAVIPSWMTTVPAGQYNIASGIRSIVFEGNVSTIDGFAFAGTAISSFSSITSLRTIGTNAFQNCTRLSTVTLGNVTGGMGNAFAGCSALQTITIPSGVNFFNDNVFDGCSQLNNVVCFASGGYQGGIFNNCSSLTNIVFPNANGVTSLGPNAGTFRNTRIPAFTFPNLTSIGPAAFANNPNLSTVFAPKATRIHSTAFSSCTALYDYPASASTFTIATGGLLTAVTGGSVAGRLTIPAGVSTIAASLFQNQTTMIGVNFPATLQTISTAAFSNTGLRTVEIPPNVTRIDAFAFAGSANLSSVTYFGAAPATVAANAFPAGVSVSIEPFSPRSIVGLQTWHDAQDATTIVRTLSSVSLWNDKSGNGYTMAPNNTSTINYTEVSPVGGYPALNFSNFAQLATPSFVMSQTNQMSLFIVMNQTGLAASGANNADFFIASDYRALHLYTSVPASTIVLWRGNTNGTANVNITNTNCIVGMVANGTTSASLFLNTSTAVTITPTGAFALASTSQYRVGGNKWEGNMCEVITYSGALNTVDRDTIEGYLAWKWGIEGNLPAAHPYKSARPTGQSTIVYLQDFPSVMGRETQGYPLWTGSNYEHGITLTGLADLWTGRNNAPILYTTLNSSSNWTFESEIQIGPVGIPQNFIGALVVYPDTNGATVPLHVGWSYWNGSGPNNPTFEFTGAGSTYGTGATDYTQVFPSAPVLGTNYVGIRLIKTGNVFTGQWKYPLTGAWTNFAASAKFTWTNLPTRIRIGLMTKSGSSSTYNAKFRNVSLQ
jgi:hypothetical protein